MNLIFDENAVENKDILALVSGCLKDARTLEMTKGGLLIICQDGKSKGYYIRCNVLAEDAIPLLDMNANLIPPTHKVFERTGNY